MFIHGLENLLDGVASQHDQVEEQQRPKDVDLYHLEVGAGQPKREGKSGPLPHLHLAQLAS